MTHPNIGRAVFVTADNYGSDATVIDNRDSTGSPSSHYKVRTDRGDEFWAFDFEVDFQSEYDSRPDTEAHIKRVQELIGLFIQAVNSHTPPKGVAELFTPITTTSLLDLFVAVSFQREDTDDPQMQAIIANTYREIDSRLTDRPLRGAHTLHQVMERMLEERAARHDASKLQEPEKSVFDLVTPKLKALTYGTDAYKASLVEMGAALRHHYDAKENTHHPDHFPDGFNGMSLLDVIEMLCDWKAAGERHANGSLVKSLEINKRRFGLSDRLWHILDNTRMELQW